MAKRYRGGIVGCGGISGMHAEHYGSSESAELVAAADLSEMAREKFSAARPGVQMYASLEAMLTAEQLDIVDICTPPAFHTAPALEAARGGIRGLLLEKPMALNLPDARRIMDECQEHQVTLAIGHQLRCAPIYLTAKRLIEEGVIGRIERIWGICHGAPLQTNATHTIDLMFYLVGDRPVDWVFGNVDLKSGRMAEGIRQEGAGIGCFQFQNGPTGLIEAGTLPPGRGYHHIYVDGEEGQIELARPNGPGLRMRSAATAGAWDEPLLYGPINPVDDLVRAIETGSEPLASAVAGFRTLELILAIFESARLHDRASLPLECEVNPLDTLFAQYTG